MNPSKPPPRIQGTLARHRSLLSDQEFDDSSAFLDIVATSATPTDPQFLRAIPSPISPSYAPLVTLSALLSSTPSSWSPLSVNQTYARLWRRLPEDAKAGRAPADAQRFLDRFLLQCKHSYGSLDHLLHSASTEPALIDPESARSVSHRQLARSVRSFSLPLTTPSDAKKPVVAISLPNGALLALTVLAVATYYTAAPVAHGNGIGANQFKSDVLQSQSEWLIASPADVARLGLHDPWLAQHGIRVLLVEFDADMNLAWKHLDGQDGPTDTITPRSPPNQADDTAILLFTSGTSGTKKLVPLSIHSLVCGVAMVVESWGLSPSTRCLNQMPLNHVGGLVRNLFAPVASGGSVICCRAFDAHLFWDCVEDHAPTWYYASPSMHQCILEAADDRPASVEKSQITLVCNAAGGLLPSLAHRIRDTFSRGGGGVDCVVLPSYGMTECMPISTPSLDYRLDKTGTSGVTVGPEIAVLDGLDRPLACGITGRVSVRGAPVFHGYRKDRGVVDTSCFTPDGWFDTGDMGYLDDQGYLYITGRSKEVINRGGELISPFEIEEAVVAASADPGSAIHGQVGKALAFSVRHNVLQEVVGIVISRPAHSKRRPALHRVRDALKSSLGQMKIPVVVVYMDDGVPTNNGKVLRINLAERMDLPEMSDDTPIARRCYVAACPPPNTPLSEKIVCEPLRVDHEAVLLACEDVLPAEVDFYLRPGRDDAYSDLFLAPKSTEHDGIFSQSSAVRLALDRLRERLDGHDVPIEIRLMDVAFPRDAHDQLNEAALTELLEAQRRPDGPSSDLLSSTETKVVHIFAQVLLSVSASELSRESDFFDSGGDSMKAGRLLSLLRNEFEARIPIDLLFSHSQVSTLATLIDEKVAGIKGKVSRTVTTSKLEDLLPGCQDADSSSTHPLLLILQLCPMVIFWPMRRALSWTIFLYCFAYSQFLPTNSALPGRLFNFVVSMGIGRLVTHIVAPLVAMAFKRLVVNRYQEGIYPMWGPYHTRWWLCEKVTAIAGRGVFGHFNWSRVLYLRLMGAKVGRNVTINRGAEIGEHDLVEIADGAVLERCKVRPMAPERGTSMYLGRIVIGASSSVGLASIVAPGTTVPDGACIGPNSSSWELADADEANRDLASAKIPPPSHWLLLDLLFGKPLLGLAYFVGAMPWLGSLVPLVMQEPDGTNVDAIQAIIVWFATPRRVGFHYAALTANAALGPLFFFAAALAVKRLIDWICGGGVVPTDARSRSAMTSFRMQFTRQLMPAPRLHEVTALFGSHYEVTSVLFRALGAKVGKHVYWPGTGPSTQDYDLLDVGDNVIFGSRSHLVTSDGTGSQTIRIEDAAMVADRVVLLPGSRLGQRTVMGSGALARRDGSYPSDTTWVGSRKNDSILLKSSTTTTTERRPLIAVDAAPLSPPKPCWKADNRRSSNSSSTTLSKGTTDSECSSLMVEKDRSKWSNHVPLLPGQDHGGSVPASSDHDQSRKSGDVRQQPESDLSTTTLDVSSRWKRLSKATMIHLGITPLSAPSRVSDRDGRKNRLSKLSRRDPSSVSTLQEKGIISHEDVNLGDASPFARAFYYGKAPYRVWGMGIITLYSFLIRIFSGVFWNIGSVSAVQVVARLYQDQFPFTNLLIASQTFYRPLAIYILFLALISTIMFLQSLLVVLFLTAAKWVLMGRRRPGSYDWDKSSYCQRWQLYLSLEVLRRECYGGMGVLGLLTGTHWLVVYFRALGARIGRDCALFAGGQPSLYFTEPDLLTLGDRVSVDDASLVGHINTAGKFSLHPLHVGDRSVLRSGSRLLSGATCREDTCLLEHTLVMAGDVVDAGSTVQGWPAELFSGSRMPTMKTKQVWTTVSG